MIQLPRWILTSKNPAFYETESATAIEMVAKLYGAMQTLVDEYNAFAESTEKKINDFVSDVTSDQELFKIGIRQEFQDFIDVVEMRIDAAENYMKDNLAESLTQIIENRDITLTLDYDEATEELNLVFTGGE